MKILLALLEEYWKPLAITLLVAFLLWRSFSLGVSWTNDSWNLKWVQRDLQDSTATLHQEVAERAEEQRRQAAVNEEQKRAQEELAKNDADAAAAERNADQLQQQLKQLRRQFAASETSKLSTAAAVSQAKAEAVMVLTDVLGKSVERNRQLAKTADDDYTSSGSCERTYNKVTEQ